MELGQDPAPAVWRHVLPLTMAGLVLFLAMSLRPPIGSDMRYVEAAREMLASGDWTIPHLAYVPYFEKPILIYWLGAASQWLFGSSAPAQQLPSALATTLSVAIAYRWGRSVRGPRFGLLAALLLMASGLFLAMGSILTTDPPLAACIAGAFYAYWRHEATPGRGWIWTFWIAAAIGALAKGPIAWVLIGCGIGGYLAISRSLHAMVAGVLAMRPLRGLGILLLINLPWWWVVWRHDPRFVEFFFERINLQGLIDPNVNHPGPPTFYLGILAGGLAPFSLILVPLLAIRCWAIARAMADAIWQRLQGREPPTLDAVQRGEWFWWCTAVFPLLFLSASASKLPAYVLPLFPSVVMLAAVALQDRLDAPPAWMRWVLWIQTVLAVPACVLYFRYAFQPDAMAGISRLAMDGLCVGLLLATAAFGLAAISARSGRILRALAILGGGTILAALLSAPFITAYRMTANATPLTQLVRSHRQDGDVVVVATDLVQDYEITLGLQQRYHVLGSARETGMGHFTEATSLDAGLPLDPDDLNGDRWRGNRWLLSHRTLAARWRGPARIWLFADDGVAAALRRECLIVYEIGRTRKALLVSNQPATWWDHE